ncbi:methyltransferase [Acidihalobacter yilgarnensis]|uniref:Prepilin leader peptidase/N-methyltransferase n=1 Tax=Acidihalobacter yilgarnensis TaxID=2819280 RepID=A0A1D8IRI8_9GAMM|nr:A24 family peptidase [Acidihalobacter yilgarnensis]AOU98994.1 methyltransferase [Acidihalobacter yilgarnensis]
MTLPIPIPYLVLLILTGLVIGSFVNVVIHRLPRMMALQWRRECAELGASEAHTPTEDDDAHPQKNETYNLVVPRSSCPHCGHMIAATENIPILSYLWQRGRCAACRAPISPRYPIIELLGALLAAMAGLRFGLSWETLAAAVLGWSLLAAAAIDLETQLLPDSITLPLLWLGLLLNIDGLFVPLRDAVIGAMAGYLSLWLIYHLFRLLTGKEGMGYGDFKLLALLGAWFGWQLLPLTILLSSLVGALAGLSLMAFRRHHHEIPIPFGPYLAAAGWIALLWGHALTGAYLRFAHIGG